MPQLDWQRSSHCAEGNSCVYVARRHAHRVLVSDSPAPGTVVALSSAAWGVFLRGLVSGGTP
ncbi:DUF397 domain-containing protein [Streptomyces sp. NPDC029003]|uniref:DUF397 domain-containing protein n=1 Tax=Streptomyces sp. NPDC029003 TaxID=3155125 RepID=UPI0033DFA932